MLRACHVLTILTSKLLSRAGVVQILSSSTSKSAPIMPVFNDFDFRIALARRRGANFAKLNFQKCSDTANFERFWLPNRSRAQAWCKFCRHLGQPILRTTSLFGPTFASLRSHETTEKHSISRNSYPPKSLMSHVCAVKHLFCPTSNLRDLPATFSIVGS